MYPAIQGSCKSEGKQVSKPESRTTEMKKGGGPDRTGKGAAGKLLVVIGSIQADFLEEVGPWGRFG